MDYLKLLNNKRFELKSIKELQDSINDYFLDCELNDIPLTITGLALYLGTNRQTLIRYENEGYKLKSLSDEDNKILCDTIKAAKAVIENKLECSLLTTKNPTGLIFNFKNNFGWVDKQEIVASSNKGPDLSNLSENDLKNLLEMPETKLIE